MTSFSARAGVCIAAFVWASAPGSSHGAYVLRNLNPPGARDSRATGAFAAQQVGFVSVETGGIHASLWNSTAASWVDLHPSAEGITASYALSAWGGSQGGSTRIHNVLRAALWQGSAGSWVDLHPSDATQSEVLGVAMFSQVGYARFDGMQRASMWSGSAASRVDLAPAGSTLSIASCAWEDRQGGWAGVPGAVHAGVWRGSAESWTDLHPAGASNSFLYSLSGNTQVGCASFGSGQQAGLWHGTAGSWVRLSPPGSTTSCAFGAYGGVQVGSAVVGNLNHAGMWLGSAESWVDLHPSAYFQSRAQAVWETDSFRYVSGYGVLAGSGLVDPLLWIMPIPAPGALAPLLLAPALCGRRSRPAAGAQNEKAPGQGPGAGAIRLGVDHDPLRTSSSVFLGLMMNRPS